MFVGVTMISRVQRHVDEPRPEVEDLVNLQEFFHCLWKDHCSSATLNNETLTFAGATWANACALVRRQVKTGAQLCGSTLSGSVLSDRERERERQRRAEVQESKRGRRGVLALRLMTKFPHDVCVCLCEMDWCSW